MYRTSKAGSKFVPVLKQDHLRFSSLPLIKPKQPTVQISSFIKQKPKRPSLNSKTNDRNFQIAFDRSNMAAAALREKQAPLKEEYKSNPSSAVITLSSKGSLDSSGITCKLETGKAISDAKQKIAGLHQKAGGEGEEISGELCSGDMLLEALVACAGVTLKAVSTALDIPIKKGTVHAEGDLDFKGTMGVDRNAPVGFTAIRLGFDLQLEEGKEVSDEKIEKLGKLTERYCVVLQTIAKKPELSVSVHGKREKEPGVDESYSWAQKS